MVFPTPAASSPALLCPILPEDPASTARTPLPRDAFLRSLRAVSPTAAYLTRLQLYLLPFTTRFALRSLLYFVGLVALIPSLFVLNDGRFGSRQLVGGTLGVLAFGIPVLIIHMQHLYRIIFTVRVVTGRKGDENCASHAWAGIARWVELAGLDSKTNEQAGI
jgi:hypothetical protein